MGNLNDQENRTIRLIDELIARNPVEGTDDYYKLDLISTLV